MNNIERLKSIVEKHGSTYTEYQSVIDSKYTVFTVYLSYKTQSAISFGQINYIFDSSFTSYEYEKIRVDGENRHTYTRLTEQEYENKLASLEDKLTRLDNFRDKIYSGNIDSDFKQLIFPYINSKYVSVDFLSDTNSGNYHIIFKSINANKAQVVGKDIEISFPIPANASVSENDLRELRKALHPLYIYDVTMDFYHNGTHTSISSCIEYINSIKCDNLDYTLAFNEIDLSASFVIHKAEPLSINDSYLSFEVDMFSNFIEPYPFKWREKIDDLVKKIKTAA